MPPERSTTSFKGAPRYLVNTANEPNWLPDLAISGAQASRYNIIQRVHI